MTDFRASGKTHRMLKRSTIAQTFVHWNDCGLHGERVRFDGGAWPSPLR